MKTEETYKIAESNLQLFQQKRVLEKAKVEVQFGLLQGRKFYLVSKTDSCWKRFLFALLKAFGCITTNPEKILQLLRRSQKIVNPGPTELEKQQALHKGEMRKMGLLLSEAKDIAQNYKTKYREKESEAKEQNQKYTDAEAQSSLLKKQLRQADKENAVKQADLKAQVDAHKESYLNAAEQLKSLQEKLSQAVKDMQKQQLQFQTQANLLKLRSETHKSNCGVAKSQALSEQGQLQKQLKELNEYADHWKHKCDEAEEQLLKLQEKCQHSNQQYDNKINDFESSLNILKGQLEQNDLSYKKKISELLLNSKNMLVTVNLQAQEKLQANKIKIAKHREKWKQDNIAHQAEVEKLKGFYGQQIQDVQQKRTEAKELLLVVKALHEEKIARISCFAGAQIKAQKQEVKQALDEAACANMAKKIAEAQLEELKTKLDAALTQISQTAIQAQKVVLSAPPENGMSDSISFLKIEVSNKEVMPACNLDDYCAIYNPNIVTREASKLTAKGKELIEAILAGTHTSSKDMKVSQEEIAYLTWYAMSAAIQKGQGFHEGTFIIEDKEQKIYQYLLQQPGVGKRTSSHFIGRSPDATGMVTYAKKCASHYGIDIKNGLMPAKKRTIDFELVDMYNSTEKLLYFKPENFSPFLTAGVGEFLNHGKEFLVAQSAKKIKGADDLPGMQKERVPAAALEAFTNFIKPFPNTKEMLAKASLWGIAYMHDELQKHQEPASDESLALELELKKYDNIPLRTGREVIITFEDMR